MRNLFLTVAAVAMLSACGDSSSKVKLDATDGITLDGTFQEAIADLSPSDKLKAAAGMLIVGYEGQGKVGDDFDHVREAKEDASFFVDPNSGDGFFNSRGGIFEEIATESNGALDGKSAQDLIDIYNLRTGQYDEYRKDQEEAEAAAKREAAAKAEAERMAGVTARKAELRGVLADLDTAKADNAAKLAELKAARDAADAAREAMLEKARAMTGNAEPSQLKNLPNINRFDGRIIVTIKNTTDAPITNPHIRIGAAPKTKPSAVNWSDRGARPYKGEEGRKPIAPGASRPLMYSYSTSYDASAGYGTDLPVLSAYVIRYTDGDGETVTLEPSASDLAPIKAYEDAVTRCAAADKVLAEARTAIPAALEALDADGADPASAGKIGEVRC